jgi:hypothetical protein
LEEGYRLVFFFWDEEGNLSRVVPEQVVRHWYPTWLWEPDQIVKVTLPPLPLGDLPHAGVAVLRPHTEDTDADGRVVPITSPSGAQMILRDNSTILELPRP